MKRNWRAALAVAGIAVLLVGALGCASGPSDEVTTIEVASGSVLYDGEEVAVLLEANATTGYEWTSQIEGSGVKAKSDDYVTESDPDNAKAGEGGTHVFDFAAEGSGEAVITLTYARSWESSDADKTVTIKTTTENGAFTSVTAEEK